MRDISSKTTTLRTAVARSTLVAGAATIDAIRAGVVPKGDPLAVAKVAAVQAAKETSRLIPYCHPIPIDFVDVAFKLGSTTIEATVTVKAIHTTGVEMEALTGAAVAALTLYDMLKMLDAAMEIGPIRLLEKHGGKSSFPRPQAGSRRAAVIVSSDSVAAGKAEDRSGQLLVERLAAEGFEVAGPTVVPDDVDALVTEIVDCCDEDRVDLVVTTGGTGLGPRDVTPEAMGRVIEREAPGIAEAARHHGQERTPFAMLSRGRAGMRGTTLIINLPGSAQGVAESLDALFPGLLHAFAMIEGGGHAREGRSGAPPADGGAATV
jgi:molybdenum cofactor biosynthesis protein MoaC